MVLTSDTKSSIIEYLNDLINEIKKTEYVDSAKVDVTLNNDILDGTTNYKEYNISIRVKE